MFRSEYYLTLPGDVKRHDEKLKIIDNTDPYILSKSDLSDDLNFFPELHLLIWLSI